MSDFILLILKSFLESTPLLSLGYC